MKAKEFKAHGYCAICNNGGIEVMQNQSNDEVIYRLFGKVAKRWQEVKYTNEGRPYFVAHKTVYYLDEFMRQKVIV